MVQVGKCCGDPQHIYSLLCHESQLVLQEYIWLLAGFLGKCLLIEEGRGREVDQYSRDHQEQPEAWGQLQFCEIVFGVLQLLCFCPTAATGSCSDGSGGGVFGAAGLVIVLRRPSVSNRARHFFGGVFGKSVNLAMTVL